MGSQYLAQQLEDYASVARELEQEIDDYDTYMQLFMKYLEEYLPGKYSVGGKMFVAEKLPEENHVVYQGMGGDLELITAIMAEEEAFLEFGRHYSGESLELLDPLAIDCVEEFLNVVNGFFSVQMSEEEGKEVDLEPPQYVRDVEPLGSHLLSLCLRMEFGEIYVLLSTDVVFGET